MKKRGKAEPRMANELLAELLKERGLQDFEYEEKIYEGWLQIVGPKIAKEADILKIERGMLFLRVANPAWRNELFFMRDQIIKLANEYAGRVIVKDIKLTG